MNLRDRVAADLRGTGVTVGPHPVALERERLRAMRVYSASQLPKLPRGKRVRTGGLVIVRQRPGTAKGFVFLSIEDETGISNVIIDPDTYEKNRAAVLGSPLLVVEGILEQSDGVTGIKGDRFFPLVSGVPSLAAPRDLGGALMEEDCPIADEIDAYRKAYPGRNFR